MLGRLIRAACAADGDGTALFCALELVWATRANPKRPAGGLQLAAAGLAIACGPCRPCRPAMLKMQFNELTGLGPLAAVAHRKELTTRSSRRVTNPPPGGVASSVPLLHTH